MLWLALHLPHLALDLLTRGGVLSTPIAMAETVDGRHWVHDCNGHARRAGVAPGMTLSSARSICADLQVHTRDPSTELAALKRIAVWAGQFTSTISLNPPQGVLLEIEGSLALFGGAGTLRDRVAQGMHALGYHAHAAIAPAPLGAWLLARGGGIRVVTDKPSLAAVLRKLPIESLERSDHVLQALRGMGLRTVGDCLRLPRDGVTRRFGPEFLNYLDRALGRRADPRADFEPPVCYQGRITLPTETTDAEALLFATHRLLLELEGFLRARGSGVQGITLLLSHSRELDTPLHIALITPQRDARHMALLLRERLMQVTLNAPVEAVALKTESLSPLQELSADLFGDTHKARDDGRRLLDRLRAHLGREAVSRLQPFPDHRPERAWAHGSAGKKKSPANTPPRPLWLLHTPAQLKLIDGEPWCEGRLAMESGPERIESGWWDGADAARDYFVAANPHHERFWIYRELRGPKRWYLHGIFS